MALIVQKYGGTSVGTVDRILEVARRVVKTVQLGNSLVVVLSAMGKTTDGLVKLAKEISPNPNKREMDMLLSTGEQVSIALLSMALQEMGQPAISLTGAQVGIVTEAAHTRARILRIDPSRMETQLNSGKVVVVAGFQGIADAGELEITTLGRGGSDTTAVALAAALRADKCEIYTDVPGILTTDPRLVADAQLMDEITCDEMLELASLGAKVLHPRAVEIAKNYGVPLVVLSSWSDAPGTQVVSPPPQPRPLEGLELAKAVDAVEFDLDQAGVSLLRLPDRPGVAARLFGAIAQQNLDVDLIIQSIHEGNTNDIAFTVRRNSLNQAVAVADAIVPALGKNSRPELGEPEVKAEERPIAKVSIAGAGMIGRPRVAAEMFKTLADAGINIQMISTSEVKVSCTIDAAECDRAVAELCKAFDVANSPIGLHSSSHKPPAVRAVALDLNQARLAIRQLPDRPGVAAKMFGLLAEENISVDTIIQSQRCHNIDGILTRDIAFTVAQIDAAAAKEVLEKSAVEFGWGEVAVDTEIAKVSVVGSGMVAHPGVAAKMFEALSQHKINIQMIATSEIKISCVVDEAQGVTALKAIHAAFELSGSERIQVPA
ncbi:MAG: aspartate kinase [Microcoleus sp. PH2017_22_RUC_O_B]|uniref:aspartate kinase n=1 Tax=unclassified Microcoleus TaxID=2642155 RepID=UPI001D79E200|nr:MULTISPECIES: aspartate kinase [unclassified Microcoleus]MCC3529524.1 aspartate kinase [Microcoleus sp. PH2017_21_RUC_O_A]MCC3541687.1 aspartate kinase [Microcoleus sp. PH2017_22_RUC_O_B]